MSNDTVEVPDFEETTLIERIDKKDLKPLWDEHDHHYILDPTDDEPGYFAEICAVDGCGLGRLIKKT